MYVQQIGEVVAKADYHLKSRAVEAPSEVNGGINKESRSAVRASEEKMRAAKQLIEQTRIQAEQSRRRAEEIHIQQQQAEDALQRLQPADFDLDNFSSFSKRGQIQSSSKLAAKRTTPIQRTSVRFAARVNQVSSKHSSTSHISSKSASHPFYFKCEGEHNLESHGAFKSSSAGERASFLAKHRLCFC